MPECAVERPMQALIFDLDGTLVDTVYPHVVAWQQALEEAGMTIHGWGIHPRIGMSGGVFPRAAFPGGGRPPPPPPAEAAQKPHGGGLPSPPAAPPAPP